jgi:hypothetical protein
MRRCGATPQAVSSLIMELILMTSETLLAHAVSRFAPRQWENIATESLRYLLGRPAGLAVSDETRINWLLTRVHQFGDLLGVAAWAGPAGVAFAGAEPRRPKPAPGSAAVSLPGPADEPYLDLAAVSAPAARPATAGALQRPPDTCRPGPGRDD